MYTAFEAGLESRHALAKAAPCYGGRPESGFLLRLGNTRFQIRLLLSPLGNLTLPFSPSAHSAAGIPRPP